MIKKIFLLTITVACAIFVDGTLTHDILDYRLDSFSKWATVILIVAILLSISLPKTNKNNNDSNNF